MHLRELTQLPTSKMTSLICLKNMTNTTLPNILSAKKCNQEKSGVLPTSKHPEKYPLKVGSKYTSIVSKSRRGVKG